MRLYLEVEIRRVDCKKCGKVKQEKLDWLADNPFYTTRFAFFVGRRCRTMTIKDVAEEPRLDLEDDQRHRGAVYARAGASSGQACSEGGRDRRDLDPQGAHLPQIQR